MNQPRHAGAGLIQIIEPFQKIESGGLVTAIKMAASAASLVRAGNWPKVAVLRNVRPCKEGNSARMAVQSWS